MSCAVHHPAYPDPSCAACAACDRETIRDAATAANAPHHPGVTFAVPGLYNAKGSRYVYRADGVRVEVEVTGDVTFDEALRAALENLTRRG